MTVTVHFTDDDVRARADDSTGSEHFTLTPSAFLAARRAGLNPRNTLETFTDWSHARCVAAGRRAGREFDAATAGCDLPASVRLVGRQAVMRIAFITRRIVHSLPAGRWSVRANDGTWQLADTPARAVEVLLPRMLDKGDNELVSAGLPPFPKCYRVLVRLAAGRLARKGPWAMRPGRKLKLGFAKALAESGFRTGNIRLTKGEGSEYARLFRTAVGRSVELPFPPLAATDTRVRTCMDAFGRVTESLGDPCTRAAWRTYLPYLENNLAAMLGIVEGVPPIFRRMRRGITVAYEANTWLSAALFDAARDAGWPTVVANHNSHPRTGQAIADFVLGALMHHRTGNPLLTDAVCWSPRLQEWPRRLLDDDKIRIRDYRVEYPPCAPAARNRPLRILHAGNYQNWSDFFPWVAETADEFVRGIAGLATAAAEVPGIELTFRIRPKDEVDAGVVRACIPNASNVRTVSIDQDFLEQLAECDLLISHFSTTVEQALQMGIPVLLWGSAHRYRQFRARMSPPTASDRSAVYAVADPAGLPSMLAGIRDAHAGARLTDEEFASYRFSRNADGLYGVARDLMTGLADPARNGRVGDDVCGHQEDRTGGNGGTISGEVRGGMTS